MTDIEKQLTLEKQIEEYLAEQAECTGGYHPNLKINISWSGNKCIISLKQDYEGIGSLCNFARLLKISQILGTEEIDLENQYYRGGCETCDYGSYDEVDIVCYNYKL